MFILKNKIIVIVLLLINHYSYSQKGWGIGGCGLYNINNNNIGIGARLLIPISEKLWAVPYLYHYFPTNFTSGGVSAMVPFYKYEMFSFYAIASGTFRAKVSVSINETEQNSSKSYKAEGEGGFGVLIGNGCLKGMFEPRYAVLSEEYILRAGLVYFFSCTKGKSNKFKGGKNNKSVKNTSTSSNYTKRKTMCPAYH